MYTQYVIHVYYNVHVGLVFRYFMFFRILVFYRTPASYMYMRFLRMLYDFASFRILSRILTNIN